MNPKKLKMNSAYEALQKLSNDILKLNYEGSAIFCGYKYYIPRRWVESQGLSVMISLEGATEFLGDFFEIFNKTYNEKFYFCCEPDSSNRNIIDVFPFKFIDVTEYNDAYYDLSGILLGNFLVFNESLDTIFYVSSDDLLFAFGDLEKLECVFEVTQKDIKTEMLNYIEKHDIESLCADYYWGPNWKSEVK
ncbi:hypothetical protein [Vibrio coralliilyticus]|uniref:hypothetical protein n=1 Tax=Vibrio coralliilyticus TaxID=190893 RepID=UPI0024095249|nr:hypothetical protein [Vibrio coralliilyticus]WFB47936.1 hypothetical protein P6988_01565 [Vibrio coralliilyticus]